MSNSESLTKLMIEFSELLNKFNFNI